MSIWIYGQKPKSILKREIEVGYCIYCKTLLSSIPKHEKDSDHSEKKLNICSTCGWWQYRETRVHSSTYLDCLIYQSYASTGILKELNLTDINQPIEELKRYIRLKYEERFNLHPRLFERLVASVFEDFGYRSKLTSYHNDGGIDVILENSNNDEIGVQIKRYKSKIDVSQIREFTGSLFLKGLTRGIFVTTSAYQRGVPSTANISRRRGIPIELVDSSKFYDALGIRKSNPFKNISEWKEQTQIKLRDLQEMNTWL